MAKPNNVGKHYRWRKFEFWAQGGRVYYLDTELIDDTDKPAHERCRSLSPADFLKRIIALYLVHKDAAPDSRIEFIKLREEAEACAREAKHQGDITDPAVQADLAKAGVRRTQVGMPTTLFGDKPTKAPPLNIPQPQQMLAGVTWTFKNDPPETMFADGIQYQPQLK